MEWTSRHEKARALLIKVAEGAIPDKAFPRLIGYKDFWERVSRKQWSRSHVKEIIALITEISAFEAQHGRPMLNELVVNVSGRNRGLPGESLNSIISYIRSKFNVQLPDYQSHTEAQRACWAYWGSEASRSSDVVEGELEDRAAQFRKRNSKIIQDCKRRDNYTCQACSFRLKIGRVYIIDCHHLYPFRGDVSARVTSLDDLVCLCPTCHRIAHTRRPLPLSTIELQKVRGFIKGK